MTAQKPMDTLPGTFQYLLPVHRPAPPFPVEEIETQDKEASFSKPASNSDKEGMGQIVCRSMGQDDPGALAGSVIIGYGEDS
jgi:hypothetical protein